MSEPQRPGDYLTESILMWQEFDPAEQRKIREALLFATTPIREIVDKHCRWEESCKLYLTTTASRRDYTHLYFWLCGYGDRMNLDIRKKPYCPPPTV